MALNEQTRDAGRPRAITQSPRATWRLLRANAATILDLPIMEVPHFLREFGSEWPGGLARWLLSKCGLHLVLIEGSHCIVFFHIAIGRARRAPITRLSCATVRWFTIRTHR